MKTKILLFALALDLVSAVSAQPTPPTIDTYENSVTLSTGAINFPGSLTDEKLQSGDTFDFSAGTFIPPAISFPSGVDQIFNPNPSSSGFNFGVVAGNPSSTVKGDAWFNTAVGAVEVDTSGGTPQPVITVNTGATLSSGRIVVATGAASTAGYAGLTSDTSGNVTEASFKIGTGPTQHFYTNSATAGQSPVASTRTYLSGSTLAITAGQIQVGTILRWTFDMTKTAAGTASSTIDIAFGTTGTTSDTAQVSFTKPAGTAAIDEGMVTITAVVRTNTSSGVVLGHFTMTHNGNTVGHMTIPVADVQVTSGTFNLTTPTYIGICITTGASDAITINQVTAEALNL